MRMCLRGRRSAWSLFAAGAAVRRLVKIKCHFSWQVPALGEGQVSLFVAGAAFGDVQALVFVAGAALGDVQVSLFVAGVTFRGRCSTW